MSRALSKASDEALCLAFLMDVDVNLILSAPEEKRMETFWKQIPKIPVSLVFSRAPEKLDTPGFHWAPKSFCGPIPDDVHDTWGGSALHLRSVYATKVSDKGILVKLPGILFHPVHSPTGWSVGLKAGNMYSFCTLDNRWFSVRLGASWGPPTLRVHPEDSSQDIAFILAKPLNLIRPGDEKHVENIPDGLAVVSKLVNIHNDTFYVNCLQHAIFLEIDNSMSLIYTPAIRAAESLWVAHDAATERIDMLQYGGGHINAFRIRLRAAKETADTQNDGDSSHHVVLKCWKLAEAALNDGELLNTCLQAGLCVEYPELERPEKITLLLAIHIHEVFMEGYNKAEVLGSQQQWYVD